MLVVADEGEENYSSVDYDQILENEYKQARDLNKIVQGQIEKNDQRLSQQKMPRNQSPRQKSEQPRQQSTLPPIKSQSAAKSRRGKTDRAVNTVQSSQTQMTMKIGSVVSSEKNQVIDEEESEDIISIIRKRAQDRVRQNCVSVEKGSKVKIEPKQMIKRKDSDPYAKIEENDTIDHKDQRDSNIQSYQETDLNQSQINTIEVPDQIQNDQDIKLNEPTMSDVQQVEQPPDTKNSQPSAPVSSKDNNQYINIKFGDNMDQQDIQSSQNERVVVIENINTNYSKIDINTTDQNLKQDDTYLFRGDSTRLLDKTQVPSSSYRDQIHEKKLNLEPQQESSQTQVVNNLKQNIMRKFTQRFSKKNRLLTNKKRGQNDVQPLPGSYHRRSNKNYDDDNSQEEDNDNGHQENAGPIKEVEDEDQVDDSIRNSLDHSPNKNLNVGGLKGIFNKRIKNELYLKVRKSQYEINSNFKNYSNMFDNLTRTNAVMTENPIVSIMITYDSSRAITVTKRNDREYHVDQFDLQDPQFTQTFHEVYGGKQDSYIKMKDIEQDSKGSKYCAPYVDDGIFMMRVFDQVQRPYSHDEILESVKGEFMCREVNINEILQLDNSTMPNQGFSDPYIVATFCNHDECIFVNLFHNCTKTHYHFVYEIHQSTVTFLHKRQMGGSKKNFPYKCFYNEDEQVVYSFYRQGQAFIVPTNIESLTQCKKIKRQKTLSKLSKRSLGKSSTMQVDHDIDEPEDYTVEQITEKDLGQMYLIDGKALIARSSSLILFFKQVFVEDLGCTQWKQYHTLEHRGFIYFIKGNKRIQVTTDEKIFFYLIDPVTFEPTLENVMHNFMNCNQMMFGSKVRYCITYKTNQKNFEVYTRRYEHDFMVTVVKDNLEGSLGVSIESQGTFIISNLDTIRMYDSRTFQELVDNKIKIKLLPSTTREINEIIAMATCHNDEYLAIISGKNLIMNQQKPNQLFIYQRIEGDKKFVFVKKIMLVNNEEMQEICMQFYFKIPQSRDHEVDSIIFAKKDCILELNFQTGNIKYIAEFQSISTQPEFFLLNDDQNAMVIASQQDCIYYDLIKCQMHDLDKLYQISCIKEIIYDIEDQSFYLLANKHQEKLGCFMIKFHENDPTNKWKYLMQLKNKLDIADADIFVLRNKKEQYKELVVSYKTIYINTYNISIIDLSNTGFNQDIQRVVFRHESFQLWESSVRGFLLNRNKDFITLSRAGIQVTALGSIPMRKIKTKRGINKKLMMLHSLESVNYLKIDPDNCVLFDFAGDNKEIAIQQQYKKQTKDQGDQTKFDSIYKLRIFDITLRELLLLQSIQYSVTLTDILQLVKDQPNAAVFYKSFLELDLNNMCSILSFDSRSMKVLLDEDKNKSYFQEKFPIFYKNKIRKSKNSNSYFYRSAIDSALINNQIIAIEYMIGYIVKYQNNYTSSFMFQKTFIKLMEKGIAVHKLLDSEIFRYKIDFDEWPQTHTDRTYCLRPFHSNIFELRDKYISIFEDIGHHHCHNEDNKPDSTHKLFKVEYTVNLLPNVSMYFEIINGVRIKRNPSQSLMLQCSETEELDVFKTGTMNEVIDYKWKKYGKGWHLAGCTMHFIYIICISQFVNEIYVKQNNKERMIYLAIMSCGIVYPLVYDTIQLCKLGIKDYFSEFWNYTDFFFIWLGFLNIVLQYFDDAGADGHFDEKESSGVMHLIDKTVMIMVILLAIVKTFFYLRVFESLSYIVTMLKNVIYDLRVFLIFYFMVIFLFGLIFSVLGVGNMNAPGDYKELRDDPPDTYYDIPYEEYDQVGMFVGNIIYVMRASIGDFDFGASEFLNQGENIVFWLVWALIVILLCIIFLNFIISEIGASYDSLKEKLDQLVIQERASLISEAEDMMFERFTDENTYPRCIIERQVY